MNRNSGFTVNKLMLGREVNTPADLLYLSPGGGGGCGREGLSDGSWTGGADRS